MVDTAVAELDWQDTSTRRIAQDILAETFLTRITPMA
jgi:hypothetical protein